MLSDYLDEYGPVCLFDDNDVVVLHQFLLDYQSVLLQYPGISSRRTKECLEGVVEKATQQLAVHHGGPQAGFHSELKDVSANEHKYHSLLIIW